MTKPENTPRSKTEEGTGKNEGANQSQDEKYAKKKIDSISKYKMKPGEVSMFKRSKITDPAFHGWPEVPPELLNTVKQIDAPLDFLPDGLAHWVKQTAKAKGTLKPLSCRRSCAPLAL